MVKRPQQLRLLAPGWVAASRRVLHCSVALAFNLPPLPAHSKPGSNLAAGGARVTDPASYTTCAAASAELSCPRSHPPPVLLAATWRWAARGRALPMTPPPSQPRWQYSTCMLGRCRSEPAILGLRRPQKGGSKLGAAACAAPAAARCPATASLPNRLSLYSKHTAQHLCHLRRDCCPPPLQVGPHLNQTQRFDYYHPPACPCGGLRLLLIHQASWTAGPNCLPMHQLDP